MKPDKTKGKATIANQIQELALRQIDAALAYLTKPTKNYDEAIHETRRCLKRARAILRLVRAELPATTYDRDNLYFRDIGRRLTTLRDAAVMIETFAALKKEFAEQLPGDTWREVKKDLSAVRRQSVPRKRKATGAVAVRLRTARARVQRWALGFDDEAVLRDGLRKAYQRGSRAMERALEEPTAENFHEWRKQVNHLRHQLQVLQNLKIGKVKAALREFKSLAKILGLNNDLAVLSRHLDRIKRQAGKPARQAFQALIQARHEAFEAEAVKVGQRLYRQKSKVFSKEILP